MTTGTGSRGARTVFLDEASAAGSPREDVKLGPILLRQGLDDARDIIRIYTPRPTAAFSRRDSRQPGFRSAVRAAEAAGFTPVLRGPGGRLAAYHGGSVVIDHIVRVPNAPAGTIERFERYAGLHARVLGGLGVDARVGELDGEYCPGAYSVNAAGVAKIIGSAQRITRDGWLFSSVIQVTGSRVLREVLREAHRALGYRLDESTVGALEDFVPGITTGAVTRAFRRVYTVPDEDIRVARLPEHVVAEVRQEADLLEAELDMS